MARRQIGTTPVQVALRNTQRATLSVEYLPSSIQAGNVGLVYGKFGSAPVASLTSNSWDFVLNPGAQGGVNVFQSRDEALIQQDLWIISDTAAQEVNVVEINTPVRSQGSPSGAPAA